MKYITTLKALLLIGTLTGCQPQEELTIDNRTITFNVALEGEKTIQTRAYAGDLSLVDKGFTLVGYKTVGDFTAEPGSAVPNVLSTSAGITTNVASITQNATSGKFTIKLPTIGGSSGTEANEKISYFAWSGEKEAGNYGLLNATKDGMAGYPFIDVKLRRADAAQKDIVVAHAINFPNDYVVTAIDLDFHHLFSKLTFSVKNSTQTKVSIKAARLKFAKDAIYSKARYMYDCSDTVGAFSLYTDYHTEDYFTPNDWKTNQDIQSNAPITLGNLLVLPQKAATGFLALELTYTLASGDTTSSITRIVSLKGLDLRQGKNYLYTLNIHAEEVEVINATIGKWNEAPTGSLPLVPGPCGDDILLLEGTDAPYPYDGKLYWLDKSGYNNHCEIYTLASTENTITHDEAKKAYVFSRGNSAINNFIKIPKLDNFTGSLTIEMIASTEWYYTAYNPIILAFAPTEIGKIPPGTTGGPLRSALIHMFDGAYRTTFDYGGTNAGNFADYERTTVPFLFDYVPQARKTLYTFSRDNSSRTFVQNDGLYYYEEPSLTAFNDKAVPFTYGALGYQWEGSLYYLKISKKKKDLATIQADYKELSQASSYDIPGDGLSKTYLPPVTAGLLLCLDHRTGVNGGVWTDQSIQQNDATLADKGKNVNPPSGSITSKGVYFDQGDASKTFLKLSNSLGKSQYFTMEILVDYEGVVGAGANTYLVNFNSSNANPDLNRELSIHWPFYHVTSTSPSFNGTYAFFDSPIGSGSYMARVVVDINKINSHVLNLCQLSVTRQAENRDGLRVKQNNLPLNPEHPTVPSYSGSTVAQPLGEMQYCDIGRKFVGYIKSVRFYNRVLTADEQKKNYAYDKLNFGVY